MKHEPRTLYSKSVREDSFKKNVVVRLTHEQKNKELIEIPGKSNLTRAIKFATLNAYEAAKYNWVEEINSRQE